MDQTTYDKGRELRTAVLGADYVERAAANADEFSEAAAGSGHRVLLGRGVGSRRTCR